VIERNARDEYQGGRGAKAPITHAFEEQHFPIIYWARLWGFSTKTLRDWFRDEEGAGILRRSNIGRRKKRDYITIMISASAAARVYAKRTGGTGSVRTCEVM
jgi:hypothetical protein